MSPPSTYACPPRHLYTGASNVLLHPPTTAIYRNAPWEPNSNNTALRCTKTPNIQETQPRHSLQRKQYEDTPLGRLVHKKMTRQTAESVIEPGGGATVDATRDFPTDARNISVRHTDAYTTQALTIRRHAAPPYSVQSRTHPGLEWHRTLDYSRQYHRVD